MAKRKPVLQRSEPNQELVKLLNDTRDRIATEEELAEQRISFAFGNADFKSGITKDSVRAAASRMRLVE